jgi:hypothetical protein
MFRTLRALRTAIDLAKRVEELEGQVANLQFEWTDVLDKLLAREERMRKRYKTEVQRALEAPAMVESSGGNKDALRRRLNAVRSAQG